MYRKTLIVLAVVAVCVAAISTSAWAATSLYETVEEALKYSPRLKQLQHNYDAVKYDLEQTRGEYLPSIDLILGYGLDQHSDETTRQNGADPDDDEWDNRGEASLSLTQKLYDGGERSSRKAVREFLLDSVDHRVHDNAQAIALDAIIAHLDVHRQQRLVELSERTVQMHRDILESLQELREAGAGSVADVTQVQGRLARAESSLYETKADLTSAEGRYLRIVGVYPEEVRFAGLPRDTPVSLEQALQETEAGNPKVLALDADAEESAARIDLARSAYKPKVNLELKTNYRDQVEGDPSWKHTNEAMLRLRWNLFNGGQDKAGVNAAKSREREAKSSRMEQLIEALEETNTTWAQLQAADKREVSYRDAVDYNKKTLESYMQQFNVAQRSLLDVLDAENEYYQTSGQLMTSAMNKTIAAYRLLALSGRLKVDEEADADSPLLGILDSLKRSEVAQSAVLPLEPASVRETEKDVKDFLQSWVNSWKMQDLDSYLTFYSADYIPERGRSLEEWRQFRTRRLSQPEMITIFIHSIKVEEMENGHVLATFSQEYNSNLYEDVVVKELTLEPYLDSWKILKEVAVPPNS